MTLKIKYLILLKNVAFWDVLHSNRREKLKAFIVIFGCYILNLIDYTSRND
jgi:hypothetical protein